VSNYLRFLTGVLTVVPAMFSGGHLCQAADEIRATASFLRVLDKADVSSLERGVIQSIAVRPGDSVSEGVLLATLDDTTARLTLEQATLELAVAEKRHAESLAVQVAEADLLQSAGQLKQATVESEIASRIAATDLAVQIAEKDVELSGDEVDRIAVARKAFGGSVSEQQLIQRTIAHIQNQMKADKARYERELDVLRSQSRESLVEQQQAAQDRLELALRQARSDRAVMEMTLKSLNTSVAMAQEGLDRRHLESPLSGIVVERLRHVGEWVESGDPVFRIIRLDKLLVEGYVNADEVRVVRPGNGVRVTSVGPQGQKTVPGLVVFVSPEVDSVNRQVLIRAEIDNPDLAFWPGQAAEMTILPPAIRAESN
jgi:multidrug efflux pump subunit AcrA (membrane-fusion protein)